MFYPKTIYIYLTVIVNKKDKLTRAINGDGAELRK